MEGLLPLIGIEKRQLHSEHSRVMLNRLGTFPGQLLRESHRVH
jgi:hypothetical protein